MHWVNRTGKLCKLLKIDLEGISTFLLIAGQNRLTLQMGDHIQIVR